MGKRRRSRRKKNKFLRISPYIAIIGLAAGYIIKSYGGEILEDYKHSLLRNKVVSESSTEEIVEEEIIEEEVIEEPTIVLESEPEEIPEIEEEIVEEVPEYVEVISDELLTLGYDFKDIDFNELKSRDEAVCGWITLDGTNIDYEIANATDEENEYYAHHDLDGNYSKSGTIYVDSRCNSLENTTNDLSDVTLIYGHHMKHGKMFADLCKFQADENFINDHQFAVVYTPDGYAYKLTFFAGMRFSGDSDAPVYRESLEDEDIFNAYIESLKENSTFTSDVEVKYGDKIVGLITCEYTGGINSRYGLFATAERQYVDELQREESMNDNNNAFYAFR